MSVFLSDAITSNWWYWMVKYGQLKLNIDSL